MNRIVVITGSASGIGKACRELFCDMGDTVCGIDLLEGEYFQGDVADPAVLEAFAAKIIQEFGQVDILINNALPPMFGIDEGSYEDFMQALRVGVAAPYYLSKLLKDSFTEDSSIINISSTRDSQSQMQTESYSAAKGGIRALTHAMASSLGPRTRVNSISPGWIQTREGEVSPADVAQHPAGRIGKPEDIAWLCAFLASDAASFIDGENIKADGGMSHKMIYAGDENWQLHIPAPAFALAQETPVSQPDPEPSLPAAQPEETSKPQTLTVEETQAEAILPEE